MKNYRVFLYLFIFLIVIVASVIFCSSLYFTADNELKDVSSLTSLQYKKEDEFFSSDYTIDKPNVIVNPYGNSPLTALVIFETLEEVRPVVTIYGKDKLSTYTHEFDLGKKHYLPIYGLYAGVENKVTIVCGEVKKDLYIKTDSLPDDFILPVSVYSDKTKLSNDLYFFTPSSSGYTCAYDVNGDVRWYLTNYALWKIDRLRNGNLLVSTDRLINSPYYMTGLYEIDMLGKVYTEYSLSGGYHHDYYEMEDGNLLVATDNFDSGDGTVEDYIVELDRNTGSVVKSFDLKNVLNMEDGKSENWTSYDWFHNNSVWYDKSTNSITLSGRHQDAVINIDYDTGKLNWIIGDPTSWSDEYKKYFFTPVGDDFEWQWSQHAAMITPEGYVFVLDNGNNKSKLKDKYVSASDSYTRGVMYKIDTDKMTIEQVFEYGKSRGSSFYSPYISDVDYIDKDHYIVHSGGIVYVNGVNSNQPAGFSKDAKLLSDTVELIDGKIVFEIKLPTNNYRVEKMSLYGNSSFSLGKALEVGSLGKTKVDKTKLWIYRNSKDVSSIEDNYDIDITKEKDRLVFKGRFKKGQDVNVVLYKDGIAKYYDVAISKKPYTALCVDILTDEETANGIMVTKYINSDLLFGKYSIYLEIDGVLYKTDKYVKF